jgi:NADPH:quinone reductase-like Zn-dependent oxidoreductase/NAD(P)-dependent dehydrogenase (short-subunit alcohol dehydrogenase family)/acyl carrier protein
MGADCVDESEEHVFVPSLRSGGDDGEQILRAAARLYTAGVQLDWEAVYGALGSAERTLLPSYAFDRQSYWVDMAVATNSEPALHPLVQSKLAVSGTRGVYTSVVHENAPAYLRDHRVAGRAIFPAAAYLEMAHAVARDVMGGAKTYGVADVSFEAPLVLSEENVTLQVVVEEGGSNNEAAFRIASRAQDLSSWQSHVHGKVTAQAGKAPARVDLEALKARCTESIDAGEVYVTCDRNGLQYGPRFQALRSLWKGEGEALAYLELSDEEQHEGYTAHPALFDSALHALGAWVGRVRDGLFLPWCVKSGAYFKPMGKSAWVHARMSSVQVEAQTLEAELTLLNEQGETLCRFDGFMFKAVDERARAELLGGVAERDSLYEVSWTESVAAPGAELKGQWLILADDQGVGEALAASLRERGCECRVASVAEQTAPLADGRFGVRLDDEHGLREVLNAVPGDLQGVVHLWGISAGDDTLQAVERAMELQCASTLHLFKALAERAGRTPRVWLVGRNAQVVDATDAAPRATQGLLLGMSRALRLEYPDYQCCHVDLGPDDAAACAAALVQEVGRHDDSEVAWRSGKRSAARLVRLGQAQAPGMISVPVAKPYHLDVGTKGLLDTLTYVPSTATEPGPGEVRMRVLVSGLNFRDVLNALGMYPGEAGPLGCECVGIIEAVGAGVEHVQVGDEVMGIGTACFGRYVTTNALQVIKKPARLTSAEAATIPLVFLTALFALKHLSQLQRGQRILIHSGAGGVGMAAIQLARRIGAEVFTTASKGKWSTVRALGVEHILDSRTSEFADEILRITEGYGVDSVLNALTGEALKRSLELLRHGGDFLEMGKTELFEPADIAARHSGVRYRAFDLSEASPALMQDMLQEIVAGLEDGSLSPLPLREFSASHAGEAFRFMAQAKHIGKIVIRQGRPGVRAEGCYVITGGLGALGLRSAESLVERGARDVVLLGRSAPNEATEQRIAAMRERGVQVSIEQVDVSDAAALRALWARLASEGRRVRGVLHAAGQLHDGSFIGQSWPLIRDNLAAKVIGGFTLHELAREQPLDFVVMYSSIASLLGSAGQVGYAAANGFLDVLSRAGGLSGLPELSVNWGAWSGGGMAARLEESAKQRIIEQGVHWLEPQQGLHTLHELIASDASQVMVAPMHWQRYLKRFDAAPSLLERWATHTTRDNAPKTEDFAKLLRELPSAARQKRCIEWVAEQVRSVLQLSSGTQIGADQVLKDLGLDSLMTVELRNRLSRGCGTKLPASFVYDYPSVREMSAELLRTLELDGATEAQPAVLDEELVQAADLARLSDDDMVDALARELTGDVN